MADGGALSAHRRTGWLAFGGAVSLEHVRQRVVRFVACVFVDGARRPRHGQFTLPWLRECRRVIDLELVEQGIGVEKTKPLDQVQIPVPPEVTAGVPIESASVVEIR